MPERSVCSLMCLCLFLMQSLSVSNTAIWLFTLKNQNIPPHMKLVSCNVDQCCWVISRFTLIFCCSGRKHDYYLFISLQPRRVSFLGSHLLLRPLWSCRKPPRAPQSVEVLFFLQTLRYWAWQFRAAVVRSCCGPHPLIWLAVSLPFVLIRVSRFLFQAVEGRISLRYPLWQCVFISNTVLSSVSLLPPDSGRHNSTVRTCWESRRQVGCCCLLITYPG